MAHNIAVNVNYHDFEGSGLVISNFVSELADGWRFTLAYT
jgi:hypothetical protein